MKLQKKRQGISPCIPKKIVVVFYYWVSLAPKHDFLFNPRTVFRHRIHIEPSIIFLSAIQFFCQESGVRSQEVEGRYKGKRLKNTSHLPISFPEIINCSSLLPTAYSLLPLLIRTRIKFSILDTNLIISN